MEEEKPNGMMMVLHAVLKEHLPAIGILPRQFGWLRDPEITQIRTIDDCFEDTTCQVPMDMSRLGSRRRAVLEGQTSTHRIVAIVAPEATDGGLLILLNDENRLVTVIETNVSRHGNVLVGVFGSGGQKGISIVTDEQHVAQRGKKLLDGDGFKSLRIEERDGDAWRATPNPLAFAMGKGTTAPFWISAESPEED